MSEARTPAGATARSAVTISFAGAERAWAAWIGHLLERRGLHVDHRRWDSPAEVSPRELLRELQLVQGRILIVVSERYLQLGARTPEEWNAALLEVVALDPARFAAVSVTTAPVPEATAVLDPAGLTGIDAEEAERRLLDRLGLPADPMPEPADGEERGPRFPNAMSGVWGGVPRRNTRFTGRDPLLDEVCRLFRVSEPGGGVVTLCGMSGVGKTQLATEYAHRFGSEYDVVWWVNADKRVTCRLLLSELAPSLDLPTDEKYGERLRAVRDSLRRGDPYRRWLLILDGADEPDQIWDLVPTGPGHVLITSQNPEWREHNSNLLDVGVYERGESVAFIRRRVTRLAESEATELAEALEDLPLLLDQTTGWLNDSDLSVQAYMELLEDGIEHDVVKVSADFPVAFQTAWSILLNKLRETLPESVDLLRMCTFFASGSIPVWLLRDMSHDDLPERVARLFNDPLLWNRAIDQLRRYSVVRPEFRDTGSHHPALSGESFYLHRMVHQIVHKDMPEKDRQEFAEVVRQALTEADPRRPMDPQSWPAYAEIVPHLRHADVLSSTDPQVQRLVLNCLRYMYVSGEYEAGIELGERAMDTWRSLLGETHPRIWDLIHHYANVLREAGQYARAEVINRIAVDHLRDERGPHDLEHLRAAKGLAADLGGLGRYDEALLVSQWILLDFRDLLGEHSETLDAQNNLAETLRLLGRYTESLEMNRLTWKARRELLGDRHPRTLYSGFVCATDLRLLGRYAEAETVQAENVREQRIVMGPDNPQTLAAEHNLALCLYRGGDHDRAGELLLRVQERSERVLGETDPLSLRSAASSGFFLREHGDIEQARELGESVLARYESMLGAGHPFVVGCRANHALVLRNVGELDTAHDLMEQALADMTTAVGDKHPWTLGCALNTSALRNLVGDPESAATLSGVTVDRAAETLGTRHPLTLSARIAHAADLRALRDQQQAEKVEREALADFYAVLGKQHVHTVSARCRTRPYWDFEPQII
ncbi:FxSxx-COOH system tetratricopeptide repeat protein [Streptomyces sp. NPDC048278]|uniref:FxSxx-COOH system tetratricopeptide repeat protein n=1 Tax=Streptomyces sp. NPDC048278 TaxID=3155809 RepID=UPI00342B0E95